ncbi:hypothetical protein ACHWQZ_G008809 [Mnemiopsis leidyi]
MFLLFICTVAFLNFILCNSIDRENNEIPSDHALQCDQNDDIFNPDPVRLISTRRRRAVSSETSRLWPHGLIPYEIEPGIPDDIVKTLEAAMRHWDVNTCIQFQKRTSQPDYISFHHGVKVISENLVSGAVRNFQKLPNYKVNSFGKLYDYESIMHYGPRHFSSNWKNTIETRLAAAQDEIGQRNHLSLGDIEQARILYNCPRDTSGCSSMIKKSSGRVSSPNYPDNYEANLECVTVIHHDIPGSCTGILTGESGVISTMGYPNGYIGGLSCYWMIYPPPSKEIRLTFHDFNLSSGPEVSDFGSDCLNHDFLEITKSTYETERHCGSTIPNPISVNGTRITLRFSSNSAPTGQGFYASYTTVSKDNSYTPTCEEKFYKVSGTINYRREKVVCDTYTYIIALPPSFQLSYKYSGQLGVGSGVSVYRSTTELLTTYLHTTHPTGSKTLSNMLKIEVNSNQQDDSFELLWKSKDKGTCGGSYRATATPDNIFSHHSFNETDLAPHQKCTWSISSKKGITLNFLTFDLAGNGEVDSEVDSSSRDVITASRRRRPRGKCRTNYLQVTDGGRKVGRFCNERTQSVYVSKSKNIKLKLVTKRNPGKGFQIKFSRLT